MKKLTLTQTDRLRRLLPNNYPKYCRVYDNGGTTADRYTVVFTGRYNNLGTRRGERRPRELYYVGMSEAPFHPQGICQVGSNQNFIDVDSKDHRWVVAFGRTGPLGKRIHWHTLPEDCQKASLHIYKSLWHLYPEDLLTAKIQMPTPAEYERIRANGSK